MQRHKLKPIAKRIDILIRSRDTQINNVSSETQLEQCIPPYAIKTMEEQKCQPSEISNHITDL